MVTLQDHFGCVDPDCLCRADRADPIRPGSAESLPSPSQALSIPLRDWHSGGRALLPPSPTHQDSNGSPSPRNSTAARFRQAGGSSLRQQPASGSKSSHLNDTDVDRWKRNLHRHAAEQKLYFSGMTTEEHFQLNSDNNRTFIADKQKKKEQQQAALRPAQLRRATTRCMARVSRIAAIASPVDTVRSLCENIRLSGAAMEAAANGVPEEEDEDEIDSKLDKQGALLRAMTENVRGRTSASPARRAGGSSRSFLSNLSASLGGTRLGFDSEGSETVNPDNWVLTEEEMVRLRRAATVLKMSTADVFLIKTIFDSYDLQHTGLLGAADFEKVVTELLQAHLHDHMISTARVQKLCEGYWTTWQPTAMTQSEEISFDQLLHWYSNALRANTLVTENERLRRIAVQWDMEPTAVEHLKRCFDASAKSGCIDIAGFKLVLQKALRVPAHNELPESRVVRFFKSCDDNHSGLVNFEEFLDWWAKYFYEIDGDEKAQDKSQGFEPKKSRLPFEDFYRRIRSTSTMTPDPPAYFNGILMSELFQEMENGNSSGLSSRVGSKQSIDSTDTTFKDPQACKASKNRRAHTVSASNQTSNQRATKQFQKAKRASAEDMQWSRTASC